MSLLSDVEHVFSERGPLADPAAGLRYRPQQQQLAMRIAEAMTKGSRLLAEAGTGTGKTFAYCVPALLSGKRVIVSTATKNLQDQLAKRDLPFLLKTLGLDARVALLKGRQNYLCWHRFDAVRKQPSLRFSGRRDALDDIAEWAGRTATGDRAELTVLPDDYAPWRDIDARGETCLGHRCPSYDICFVTQARAAAMVADIVIVNHHLFFADMSLRMQPHVDSPVLPDADTIVFDEAHALADVATEHFGRSFSNTRVSEFVHDVQETCATHRPMQIEHVRGACEQLMKNAQAFVEACANGRESWDLPAPTAALAEKTDQAFATLTDLLHDVAGDAPEGMAIVEAMAERGGQIRHELSSLLAETQSDAYARTVEIRARSIRLRAMPLDVSGTLSMQLFDRDQPVILTSATLSDGESFAHLRRTLGIDAAEEIIVPSPFHYETQALHYIPRHLPDPQSPEFSASITAEIRALVLASGGGALLLFTSLAQMRQQHAALLNDFSALDVMLQGEAPKHILLERLAASGKGVLFATSSFWEGVDVRGDSLRLVCIDKLPFSSPNDPLLAARLATAKAEGSSGFDRYQLAPALMALRQGVGRLIRSDSDRGVIALFDSRLHTRGYGKKFLRGLPPAPRTEQLQEACAFFKRAG